MSEKKEKKMIVCFPDPENVTEEERKTVIKVLNHHIKSYEN